jgi:hypothetical protein
VQCTPTAAKPDYEAIAAKEPTKVVATINGKQLTARQVADLLKLIPEDRRKNIPNLQAAVQQLYMITDLAQKATAEKLDQMPPYKQQLEVDRDGLLAQAYVAEASKKNGAPASDPKQYFDAHTSDYDRASVSGIVIAFNPPGTPASQSGGITRTEDQARQKATEVESKLKGGGDFASVAKSESDDPQSSSRGGQLGTLAASTPNLPPDLKDVIFNKLQPGQISDPVRGPNGFYILRLDNRTKETFEQARPEIEQQMKVDRDRAASQKITDQYKIQVTDPEFFGTTSAAANASKTPSLASPAPGTPKK